MAKKKTALKNIKPAPKKASVKSAVTKKAIPQKASKANKKSPAAKPKNKVSTKTSKPAAKKISPVKKAAKPTPKPATKSKTSPKKLPKKVVTKATSSSKQKKISDSNSKKITTPSKKPTKITNKGKTPVTIVGKTETHTNGASLITTTPKKRVTPPPPVVEEFDDAPEMDLTSTLPAAFIAKQKIKLEELRDTLLDQMADVAHDSLRSASEGGGGAAFGQHMGDAGSDAYERDFALSLLSQEQDSLYEINEALKRIEFGTYGMCEKSGVAIPRARLEAIPWARYTVTCQAEMERVNAKRNRWDSTPQFMDSLDSDEESEEDDTDDESRQKNKE